jgi:opacity protein-like surface antigen
MMTLISAAPLLAGDYKTVATAPPPPVYGTGFYGAIDMGANVYQNRGGDQTFTDEFDDTLTISPKNDVGFYGGIKLGYVFGTGKVRFVLEEDMFYNGFRGGADTTLNLDGVIMRSSSGTTFINTGAFMTNFMVKFGNGPFQFYFGGGVGAYFAESAGFDLNTPNHTFSTGGGGSHADLAWQVIVGADYYFTPKWSTFIEYHYLDYTSSNINTINDRDLGQHLVGAGIRFHF